MARHLFSDMNQMQKSWYIFYFQLPGIVEKLAASSNYDWALNLITSNARPGVFTQPDLEEYRKAYLQPGAFSAIINWYRASLQTKLEMPASSEVTVPMLLLWGTDDVSMLAEMADESMHYCRQGKLIKIPGTSHWVQHEEADRVNELIADFITLP